MDLKYKNDKVVHVVGGGLAGSEAAWQLCQLGIGVQLYEMRPQRCTDAHQTDVLAELVCSNSFRSDDAQYNAVGVLHEELRRCGSLIMRCADANRVPAGAALAVDRDEFSQAVQSALENEKLLDIVRLELTELPPTEWDSVIIATGPLTSPSLTSSITELTGEQNLAFYDAIAPIAYRDSIDFSKVWFQSRYDKGDGADYINCPLNDEDYENFITELLNAEKILFHDWEENTPYFEGCLPIEVMAERGLETLAFGPMKPIGLTNPHSPSRKPRAVVQLRQDNTLGTLYNMVGFQTKMKYDEQIRIFRTIPGLEKAEFARLGGIHRNTFINAPRLLDPTLRLKSEPRLRFAGQITGCEGYVESAAVGLLAGRFAAYEKLGLPPQHPKPGTALGSLLAHITGGGDPETYQPINVNFGLFPPLPEQGSGNPKNRGKPIRGRERKAAYARRALEQTDLWLEENV